MQYPRLVHQRLFTLGPFGPEGPTGPGGPTM